MSKKWIGIILVSALFLLVGCGKEPVENKKVVDDKEVISSKFTGKWKLESVSVGASDGTDMKQKVKNLTYKKSLKCLRHRMISR